MSKQLSSNLQKKNLEINITPFDLTILNDMTDSKVYDVQRKNDKVDSQFFSQNGFNSENVMVMRTASSQENFSQILSNSIKEQLQHYPIGQTQHQKQSMKSCDEVMMRYNGDGQIDKKVDIVKIQQKYQANAIEDQDQDQGLKVIFADDSEFEEKHNDDDDLSFTEFKCKMQSKESEQTDTINNYMNSIESYSNYQPIQTIVENQKSSLLTNNNNQQSINNPSCYHKSTQSQDSEKKSIQKISTYQLNRENTAQFICPNNPNEIYSSQSFLLSPKSMMNTIKLHQVQSKRNIGDQGDLISMDDIDSTQTINSKQQTVLNSMMQSQKDLTLRLKQEQNNLVQNEIQKVYQGKSKVKRQESLHEPSSVQQECSLNHPNHVKRIKQVDGYQVNQSLVNFENLEREQLKEEYRKLKKQLQEIALKNHQSSQSKSQTKQKAGLTIDNYKQQQVKQVCSFKENQNQKHTSSTSKDVSTIESLQKSTNQSINYSKKEQQKNLDAKRDQNLSQQKKIEEKILNKQQRKTNYSLWKKLKIQIKLNPKHIKKDLIEWKKENQLEQKGYIETQGHSRSNERFYEFEKQRGSVTPQNFHHHQCRKHSKKSNSFLKYSNDNKNRKDSSYNKAKNHINECSSQFNIDFETQKRHLSSFDNRKQTEFLKNQQLRKSLDQANNFQHLEQNSKRQRSISTKKDEGFYSSNKLRENSCLIIDQHSQDSHMYKNCYNKEERQINISPSKLNKELNKILETERMIKEYKEIITKMQRDLYSKKKSIVTQVVNEDKPLTVKQKQLQKSSQNQNQKGSSKKTPNSLLQKKRIFQEDINPKEALMPLLKIADADSLRIKNIKRIEDAIDIIRQKMEIQQIDPQKLNVQPPVVIYRESILSQPSIIQQDFYFRSDSKISRISISPKRESQRFTPNKQFNQRNHSNSLHQNQTIFTSFPNSSQTYYKRNKSSQKVQKIASIEKSSRIFSNEIPLAFYEKTVIPEEDQEEPTRYHNINHEDESMINAQQQLDIINFYKEFQQEDETIPTPLSIISKQPSFIAQSPLLLNRSRRVDIANNRQSYQQKFTSQMDQRQNNFLSYNYPQKDQDVKIVSIQINGNKKTQEANKSKFNEVMKITSEMLNNRQQQSLNLTKTKTSQQLTPQRSKLQNSLKTQNQNFGNSQLLKHPNVFSLNKSSFNNTTKIPLCSQKANIDIQILAKESTQLQPISQQTQAYQNVVSQILYKKSTQKGNKNSNLSKFMEDSQKRLQRNYQQNLNSIYNQKNFQYSTQQQNKNVETNYKNNTDQNVNQQIENEYMTFTSSNQNNLGQFNNQDHQQQVSNTYHTFSSANTQPCSLRSSMQIKTQTIDLGESIRNGSGSSRQTWNNTSLQKKQSIPLKIQQAKTNQTRNSISHNTLQSLTQQHSQSSSQYTSNSKYVSSKMNQSIGMISQSARQSYSKEKVQSTNQNQFSRGQVQQTYQGQIQQNAGHLQNSYSSIPVTKLSLKM
eukprot:403369454